MRVTLQKQIEVPFELRASLLESMGKYTAKNDQKQTATEENTAQQPSYDSYT